MTSVGVPDLLFSNKISRSLSQVNAELTRSSTELTTGLRDDPVAASGGDPSRLYALDRDIASAETRRLTFGVAKARAETAQSALARMESGGYGYCVLCEEEIAEGRLRFDSSVLTCISCALEEDDR